LVESQQLTPTTTFAARPEQLDLLAVIKASQSISGQIHLPDLLEALLQIVLEQAGAQRGCLLLVEGEALAIHAQAETLGATTRVNLVPALPISPTTLPVSILTYVRRTGEALVLIDAPAEANYASDEYIVRHKPRSILCLPIQRQAQLVGLLYLENNLMAGAFSAQTLTVLELLAAQAAISLDSARLYAKLQQENAERRQAEAELRASEARFRTFVDHATDAFFLHDAHGVILDMNRQACESLGYRREELLGMIPFGFDVDADRSFFDHIEARLDANEVIAFDSRHRRKDGSVFPVEVRVRSFWQGGYRFAISLVRDITERKQAERALVESYSLLHAVVEGASDVVYVKDLKGLYLMINSAGARVLGKTVEEVIGKDDHELFTSETAQAITERDRQVTASGVSQTIEEVATVAGVRRTYLVNKGVYRDRHDQVIGLIGIARDVTELKRLEEQFRQAQKMEAVGRLAGGVAHDFNNLLTVINGNSELVFGGLRADNPNRELLAEIIASGERAANLTRQLLAFSRKQMLQPEVVSLNVVLGQVLKLLQRLIGEDIELVLRPSATLGLAKVDPGQFEQAIINLLVNARDAMPDGGQLTIETVNINLDEHYAEQHPEVRPGRYVVVAVSDTGQGMDEETKACIFEPFFTTKEPGKGTGLGLAMVYGFIRQSGGHVEVYSELSHGTTFKLYLPRADESMPAATVLPSRLSIPAGSETVLVVEDEAAVRNLLRRVLQSCGYTILEAQDGKVALEIAQRHAGRIDLLVTDLVMPKMSGRELVERLTQARPGMRTLMMSGYSNDVVIRQGALQASVAFLQKPFSPIDLARKVREILDAEARRH
jgi:PAS domain S-box-containing protein